MMIFFFNVCKTSWVYDLRTLIWYFKQFLKKKIHLVYSTVLTFWTRQLFWWWWGERSQSMHCRSLSNIHVLYPLDAGTTSPSADNHQYFQICQKFPRSQNCLCLRTLTCIYRYLHLNSFIVINAHSIQNRALIIT